MKQDVYYFADNQVPQGQFSFPFSFQLPPWLPDSFFYKGHRKSTLYIRYKMKAKISDPFRKLPPIVFKRYLIVRRAPFQS